MFPLLACVFFLEVFRFFWRLLLWGFAGSDTPVPGSRGDLKPRRAQLGPQSADTALVDLAKGSRCGTSFEIEEAAWRATF